MPQPIMNLLAYKAWRHAADPGATASDIDAAEAVARAAPREFVAAVSQWPDALLTLAPDRMSRVVGWLRRDDRSVFRALGPGIAEAIREAHLAAEEPGAGLTPTRRTHALMELAYAVGTVPLVAFEDLAWSFDCDEFSVPNYFPALTEWCIAHAPLPAPVVQFVVGLRDQEINSPELDRLAAWVRPSTRGMIDLAGWEHAISRAVDDGWAAWIERRARGEAPSAGDDQRLRGLCDPDSTANVDAVHRAITLHGSRARRALALALRRKRRDPARSTILSAWLELAGGAA